VFVVEIERAFHVLELRPLTSCNCLMGLDSFLDFRLIVVGIRLREREREREREEEEGRTTMIIDGQSDGH